MVFRDEQYINIMLIYPQGLLGRGALFSESPDPIEWLKSISSKWQSIWEAEGAYRVERVDAR
ncbi:MAG: hypothetical protein QXE02_07850, partial [Sulfolobales archaeon]